MPRNRLEPSVQQFHPDSLGPDGHPFSPRQVLAISKEGCAGFRLQNQCLDKDSCILHSPDERQLPDPITLVRMEPFAGRLVFDIEIERSPLIPIIHIQSHLQETGLLD